MWDQYSCFLSVYQISIMKLFIAVALLCFCLVSTRADWAHIKTKLVAAREKCNEDPATRVSDDTYEKIKKGEKPEVGENASAFSLCVSKRMGWQDEDGKIRKEAMTEKVVNGISDPEVRKIILEKCIVDKDTPTQTAITLMRCLMRARRENDLQ